MSGGWVIVWGMMYEASGRVTQTNHSVAGADGTGHHFPVGVWFLRILCHCDGLPAGQYFRNLGTFTGGNDLDRLHHHCRSGDGVVRRCSFVAADSNAVAYNTAKQRVKMNRNLSGRIRCRKQLDEQHIFHGIIQKKEVFDLTICNPPFHASEEDAQAASQRKVDNLNKVDRDVDTDTPQSKATLNFGGQQPELWCEGGEMGFLNTMITESKDFAGQCLWFTSLVSRKEHIPELQQLLADAGVAQVKVLEMAQGNKISRIIAWSFLTSEEHLEWSEISWDAPLGQIRDAAELDDGGDEELDGDNKALDAEDLEQDDLEPNND